MWSTALGFVSENSDDEQTKYLREERRYIKEQVRKHGEDVYLKKRPMEPFEILLLKMGGDIILSDLCRKQISPEHARTVYQWVDPKLPPFQRMTDFLLARSEGQFKEAYKKERSMQTQALKG